MNIGHFTNLNDLVYYLTSTVNQTSNTRDLTDVFLQVSTFLYLYKIHVTRVNRTNLDLGRERVGREREREREGEREGERDIHTHTHTYTQK